MLPTNEKSKLQLNHDKTYIAQLNSEVSVSHYYNPQHLYIFSDEEIKEDDWHYDSSDNKIKQWKGNLNSNRLRSKKIISTTNTSLTALYGQSEEGYGKMKEGLPQPSQSFIEAYVRAYNEDKPITEVMVEYHPELYDGTETTSNLSGRLKINPKDNTITIRKVKDSWNREEHSINLQYCVSLFAAEKGLTPTSKEMKEVNDWVKNWIQENL